MRLRGFLESTCRGLADRISVWLIARLLALVPLVLRNPSWLFSPRRKLFFSMSHHENDLLSQAQSTSSQQEIFQAVMAAGGKDGLSRHEAHPTVAQAASGGATKAPRRLA